MKIAMRLAALFVGTLLSIVTAQENGRSSARFQALKCPAPSLGSTWGILDRNGANQPVARYLSSLVSGESGTGMISSPPFMIETDMITFTICGHDGQAGGRGENYIALVDARKGQVLLKTPPPQNDAMQERSWDVKGLRGNQVRIEVHDANGGGGYAWLGIGRIDAGPELTVDFRRGMPTGWAESERRSEIKYDSVNGGVPFKRVANIYTLIPRSGTVEIPCGFAASRLFLLGCTVAGARPLERYGVIEIHYRTGSPDVVPVLGGFTLDGGYKLLSPSKALQLHASADPYQHYLVIKTRPETIERIRVIAEKPDGPLPRITAVTCETAADSERLMPLPNTTLSTEERAWIESHGISAKEQDLDRISSEIRKAHRMPDHQGK